MSNIRYLHIKHPFKTELTVIELPYDSESKVSTHGSYKFNFVEDTIPKNEHYTINFKEEAPNDLIEIKHFIKNNSQSPTKIVKYKEPWKWYDCELVITKENPKKVDEIQINKEKMEKSVEENAKNSSEEKNERYSSS